MPNPLNPSLVVHIALSCSQLLSRSRSTRFCMHKRSFPLPVCPYPRHLHRTPHEADDGDEPLFHYIVVAMAIAEGALQHLPETRDPLLNRDNFQRNYQFICTSIAGVSAQLSNKCSPSFPNVFGFLNVHATPHPLAGFRELADIHRIYQRDGAIVNSATGDSVACSV